MIQFLSVAGTVQEGVEQVAEHLADASEQVQQVVTKTAEVVAENPAAAEWDWGRMLWTALICICMVFFVLILLVGIMKLFGVIFVKKETPSATAPTVSQGQIHEEEIAAIMTALKLYKSDLHDRESEVLTMLNIKRAYSPWNSKIHGLTQLPERK